MARIVLTGNLQLHTEGVKELELDVNTIRQLMRQLTTRYPGLPADLEDEVAVSIDGTIYQDDWFAEIAPDSEVHLLPKIGGG
ncbi:MAG: MoaD/ThiS family protein [Gammaproteobacteria bacterium]|jgi:molybdopterin converting factor small subunit|nr:MoaD/ThiS family protein [Gammaproteobacteria bacterium]MDG2077502.1 MoaD/ThiS family protein [Arenicellales bacterium]GIT24405.1 MAG: thiamine biosynthesis protein ThiS [Gammaproteobacteria bacterium]|tara:strand:+ start:465 stop:710 length:246 start_codon:yes stop_codon:yes gene_type:complete